MYKELETSKRTHMCGTLRSKNIGNYVTVAGWVQRRRDLGGLIFVNLRDRSGFVQVVFDKDVNPDAFKLAGNIRSEFVLLVSGIVSPREEGQSNENLPTGEIEIKAERLEILNTSETVSYTHLDVYKRQVEDTHRRI